MELLIRKPGTARSTHDEGDVFGVYPDGSLPEAPAPDSVFWRIIVTDVNPALYAYLLDPLSDLTDPAHPVLFFRRAYRVNWTKVPASIVNTLTTDRTITMSASTFKNAWIEHK